MKRVLRNHALVLVSTLALAACVTPGQQQLTPEQKAQQEQAVKAYTTGKPPYFKHFYADIVRGGDRDAVLNWMRLGKHAMVLGEVTVAAEAFDEALKRITAVYADDAAAEKARSVWHEESAKDFKGEPYERAMVFIYRGILDMLDGDYENARASFKGAMLQDSFAELERYRQDFASAAWLIGWTSRCLGDDTGAQEAFAEARDLRPALPLPDDDDRLLVLLEAGKGPKKVGFGEYKEKLAYREGRKSKVDYSVSLGDARRTAVEAEDLFMQATTRGGRQMDDILVMKAGTKTTTAAVGTGATAAGIGIMASGNYNNNGNMAAAGALVTLFGLAAQAAAEAMTPEADTRSWTTLPHSLYVATLPMAEPLTPSDVHVTYEKKPDFSALLFPEKRLTGAHGACGLAWYPSTALRTQFTSASLKSDSEDKASDDEAEDAPEVNDEPEVTEEPNCRTSRGKLKTIRADLCRSIDGTVLSEGSDASEAPDVTKNANCRTSTGETKVLRADICRAIDGTILSIATD